MTTVTWISVALLGPGALAVFAWFLRDARDLMRREDGRPDEPPR